MKKALEAFSRTRSIPKDVTDLRKFRLPYFERQFVPCLIKYQYPCQEDKREFLVQLSKFINIDEQFEGIL